jgi:hypothetical protein
MDWCNEQTTVHTNSSRSSVSVYRNLSRSWFKQSNNYPKSDRGRKRHGCHKYFLPITLCLTSIATAPATLAETVGGVSATASPVANSSGSVTNQAIQVLQGPYITNTYGGGIQCQGPTRNFTPYVTGSASASKPYEPYFNDPVYDVSDLNEDGLIDNPGDILFTKRTRTGQKDNYSLGLGFSMTWSTPTDKKLQDLCKEAASSNIEMMQQITANKRLDFEIARLKNCGELKLKGIQFHPKSPYYSVCADVLVNNPPGHTHPHYHNIPNVSSSSSGRQNEVPSQRDSSDAALLGVPLQTK